MPHLPSVDDARDQRELVFPPVTKDHIQNCSYDAWFPRYRGSCLKSRIIPLPPSVVSYLHEDGIILADKDDGDALPQEEEWLSSTISGLLEARHRDEDSSSDEDEAPRIPPNVRFLETHQLIKDTIAELGGAVAPKLNWSSPQDAKWISPHQNTLKCTSPNDVYLLLKSSSFASHDLAHAFDGCTAAPPSRPLTPILVLRPFFTPHVALEFRCFIKHRSLIAITQRDLNYYAFLDGLRPQIWSKIRAFFRAKLRLTFPDASFAFDVYMPEDPLADGGLGRVRLVDINPWAPRTDALLFSWRELLEIEVASPLYGSSEAGMDGSGDEDDDGAEYRRDGQPELRLVERDDPAAYNFSSAQFSAHKLPKEVVDASMSGEGGCASLRGSGRKSPKGEAAWGVRDDSDDGGRGGAAFH